MKRTIILMLLTACAAVVWAEEGYRIFTDVQGRAITAKILDYDVRKQTLLVQMENGRKGRISVARLSAEDQEYIRTWRRIQNFMDEEKFVVECTKTLVDSLKEEKRRKLHYTGGDSIEDFLFRTVKWEKIAFGFEFQNKNKLPLDHLRMEYHIYYEQSRMTKDQEHPGLKPVPEQLVFEGTSDLPPVPGNGRISVTTESVEIYEDDLNPLPIEGGDHRVGGKGRVFGIRARIFMTLESGEEMMRTFHHPESLSADDFPWNP